MSIEGDKDNKLGKEIRIVIEKELEMEFFILFVFHYLRLPMVSGIKNQ